MNQQRPTPFRQTEIAQAYDALSQALGDLASGVLYESAFFVRDGVKILELCVPIGNDLIYTTYKMFWVRADRLTKPMDEHGNQYPLVMMEFRYDKRSIPMDIFMQRPANWDQMKNECRQHLAEKWNEHRGVIQPKDQRPGLILPSETQ